MKKVLLIIICILCVVGVVVTNFSFDKKAPTINCYSSLNNSHLIYNNDTLF